MNKSAISAENRLDLEWQRAENCFYGRRQKDGFHAPGHDRRGAGAASGMGKEQSWRRTHLLRVSQHVLVCASAICGAASFWWRIVDVRRDNCSRDSSFVPDLLEHVAHQRARLRSYAAGLVGQANSGSKTGGKESQWITLRPLVGMGHRALRARTGLLFSPKAQGRLEFLLVQNNPVHSCLSKLLAT